MAWYLKTGKEEPWSWVKGFSEEECERIITLGLSAKLTGAKVVDASTENDNIGYERDIRKSKIRWLNSDDPFNHWIYERCTQLINDANNTYFNYDLEYLQELQFTSYDSSDSYFHKHVDNFYNYMGSPRKLTFSVQLSSPDSYTGGDFNLHAGNKPTVLPKERGVVIFFPSHSLHEVLPPTSGTRYSLVGWVAGPKFR